VWRWVLAVAVSSLLVGGSLTAINLTPIAAVDLSGTDFPSGATAAPARPTVVGSALVLFDGSGEYAPLAKVYATIAGNLVSHFATPAIRPVSSYHAGDAGRYRAVIYVGVVEGERLPMSFLQDAVTAHTPLLWLGADARQLEGAAARYHVDLGWRSDDKDMTGWTGVDYKGIRLSRNAVDAGSLEHIYGVDPSRVRVLAMATATGHAREPWAVSSGHLTYVAEVPLDAEDVSDDRYLAVTDMLFDLFGDRAPSRHQALLRFEDVGPNSDTVELQQMASFLDAHHVPYSFALYPVYVDPVAAHPRRTIRLAERPEIVRVVAYMLTHGGTMVLHGLTHQFGDLINPLSGASAADFEFFRVHTGADGVLVYDGPVPPDSEAWATQRMQAAINEVTRTGLPRPQIWEFPHYGASVADYAAARFLFGARYDRAQYFSTAYRTGPMSPYMFEQFTPYLVHDAYGSTVVPENLGYVEGPPVPQQGVGSLDAIVAGARANLVVRDGLASFFFHPYLGTDRLGSLVGQLRSLGYTFVSPGSI